MSLPPAEPDRKSKLARFSRVRGPYERWRKLALTGAVILLIGSILKASVNGFPNAINMLSLGVGWGLLAAAFGRAMMDRRAREQAAEKERR